MRHRIKFGGASLTVALALAASMAPGAAMAKTLAVKLMVGGTQITGGASIMASSTDLAISNSFWSLACSESTLSGHLGQNNKPSGDNILITEGTFQGGGEGGLCSSPMEDKFVTTLTPLQTPEFTFDHKGQVRLKYPRIRLVPEANLGKNEGQQQACVVAASKLRGAFALSETAQPLEVTFTAAKTHLEPKAGTECGAGAGAKPSLSATFTFTRTTPPVGVVEVVAFSPH